MAYAGTGNNKALKKLLHIAVTDVNDDVRRAAVTSVGFLLFKTPEQVPKVVQLLSASYSPHVRYGAAFALGIACAGTGLQVIFFCFDFGRKQLIFWNLWLKILSTMFVKEL
jgi:26S proteasome regulatory subunit N2